MKDKWELRRHVKEKIDIILALSKLLEKISKNKQKLLIRDFYAEAITNGFSEENVDFLLIL